MVIKELNYGSSFYPFSDNGLVGIDDKSGQMFGLWLKSNFPLFQISIKGKDEFLVPIIDIDGQQKWSEGCIPQNKIKIEEKIDFNGKVLGGKTSSIFLNSATHSSSLVFPQEKSITKATGFLDHLTVVASSEGGMEIVSLLPNSSAKKKEQVIDFKEAKSGEVVVSLGLLNILNILIDKALKTDFDISLVLVKNLLPEVEGKVTTLPVRYKVVGVLDDAKLILFVYSFF